jgi:dipeptidyl aminopeptidase/acylaminoacyl peptidase
MMPSSILCHGRVLARAALLAVLLPAVPLLAAASDEGQTTGYRLPPEPIPQILDTPPTPSLFVSPDRRHIALLERPGLPPIEELAEPELRLAGARINPRTNGPSRASFYRGLRFQRLDDRSTREVALPAEARLSSIDWSPDGSMLAFANTAEDGIELWVADVRTGHTRRILGPELNATLGSAFQWAPDGASLLVQRVVPGRGEPPLAPHVPSGPVIQENFGPAAPVRTYQDLLGNPHDEALFDYYFTSELAWVEVATGTVTPIGQPRIHAGFSLSPDGEYILIRHYKRPYSYIAPAFAFATEVNVLDRNGRQIHQVQDRPEVTLPPIGRDMVNTGPRVPQWRADTPSQLLWVEAMDGGNARQPAEVRDRVFVLDSPFDGEPTVLIDLDQRFSGVQWGREDFALVRTLWRTNSRTKTFIVSPGAPGAAPRLLWDRSAEDRYGDPGTPVTAPTSSGFRVLRFSPDGRSLFLSGTGASPRGDYPFLDRLDLATTTTERLWQAEDPFYEYVAAILNDGVSLLLTRRESADEAPNYFLRDLAADSVSALTSYPDPAPQLAGIQRQIITYPREDGILLSATLFTPPGYEAERDGPLPAILWAYPREFRDAAAASQITDSPNRFSRPTGSSHLFLLTQGYAIIDGPAMPIIGEGDVEPNDTYIEQLVASARAAVERAVEMGVVDRDRVGVGGHSYGAFMTANLLAHSDLFRAGVARSGAYNRTLTPFGFQAEPRSFWEARDVYLSMSPFNYAHQIRVPVLLVHGEADNNSGTFPIQSERMFQALKGHGAIARLVMLPLESHGYVARESVLHVLAETVEWMDRYVKNAPPRTAAQE